MHLNGRKAKLNTYKKNYQNIIVQYKGICTFHELYLVYTKD